MGEDAILRLLKRKNAKCILRPKVHKGSSPSCELFLLSTRSTVRILRLFTEKSLDPTAQLRSYYDIAYQFIGREFWIAKMTRAGARKYYIH